jgi:metal-responsive CopG/Arc/MetJ family transcriptional regulator
VSRKLSAQQQGEATVVAVRLPPDLLAGLDQVVVQATTAPFSHPSRSEIARGLIASALQTPLFTTEALNKQPTPLPPPLKLLSR